MRMYDIIAKKRDGHALTKEEIDFFVSGYTKGEIPDYQASALAMAIYLRGMTDIETANLTLAMAGSGDVLDLSPIAGIKVDKHSTGGVGDKTSLVLGPMVAALGVPVAKMSGRGLGHTGGTIDKLESFPGFVTGLEEEKFFENVNEIKIAIAGQTGNLAPADKKLYALRDVTATVESIPLIAASIMSKKIAAGADVIVLDVKTGSGAFMKTEEDALALAKAMVDIGTNVGKRTMAVVSSMEEPLGHAVGNALEVMEAIETLQGKGPKDLLELCLVLGAYMVQGAGITDDISEAREMLLSTITDGTALNKMKQWVKRQNGNEKAVDDSELLPQTSIIRVVRSEQEGFVSEIQCEQVGKCAMILGGGRETKESKIDLSVGIILTRKIGNYVKKGDALALFYANDKDKLDEAEEKFKKAFKLTENRVEKPKLIRYIVTAESVEAL